MKLACVVQRYSADIAGGSEAHCRQIATRLALGHDVTVLSTCATDYVTWANAIAPGQSMDGLVRVHHFPVRRPRHIRDLADLSDEVFDGPASLERQLAWFQENGPDAPQLLAHLAAHGREYDLVLFWTFRYATSFFGLPLVDDRAVLVPTAEEDHVLYLGVTRAFFRRPRGYLFLTPEEQALVTARAGRPLEPAAVIGAGLDPAPPIPDADVERVLTPLGLPARFVLYLGRVDRNKGCESLLATFDEYARSRPDVTLVLAGPATLPIPAHPQIRALGYVSDAVREALLRRAQLLVVPSPYESLSLVLLEAWNRGTPALVNAHCSVLKGQVRRANGGLHYRSPQEFALALDRLLDDDELRAALGHQGRAYVDREYRWPTVMEKVEGVLGKVQKLRS